MKIEHRICPSCLSAFFVLKNDDVVICPDCRFILLDRRDTKTKRIQKRVNFVFSLSDERFEATLEDYSTGGMRAPQPAHATKTPATFGRKAQAMASRRMPAPTPRRSCSRAVRTM